MSEELRPPSGPTPPTESARRTARDEPRSEAFGPGELRSCLRPDLAAAVVLGGADRIGRNLAEGASLPRLAATLAAASLLAATPFGAIAPAGSWWSASVLFAGSLAVCLPCLHAVLLFLGFDVALPRTLALSLVLTATAALFAFAFFPILWFIDGTTVAGAASSVTSADLMRLLLGACVFAGVVQMCRCLAASRAGVRDGGGMTAAVMLWLPLFLFIAWRMAAALGLRG